MKLTLSSLSDFLSPINALTHFPEAPIPEKVLLGINLPSRIQESSLKQRKKMCEGLRERGMKTKKKGEKLEGKRIYVGV